MTKHTDTSRSDDLVERLRERTSYSEILLCHPPRPAPDHLCHEAADRIEALEAENERLREALTLAANRMDVMALAVIHENNARRYEWHEWAVAARAALGEKQ